MREQKIYNKSIIEGLLITMIKKYGSSAVARHLQNVGGDILSLAESILYDSEQPSGTASAKLTEFAQLISIDPLDAETNAALTEYAETAQYDMMY